MDKSWIDMPNWMSIEYRKKIDEFLDFAFGNTLDQTISCPCRECENRFYFEKDVVQLHLRSSGFYKKYKVWTSHGELPALSTNISVHIDHNGKTIEQQNVADHMTEMIHDVVGYPENDDASDSDFHMVDEQVNKYYKLLDEAHKPLYSGCEDHTVLSFTVRLLQLKSLHQLTDTCVTGLLELIRDVLPDKGENVPKKYYDAQKLTTVLGFDYKTIDACPNNCMMYWKDDAKLNRCVICKKSRWKPRTRQSLIERRFGKKVAAKQMRYFPLKTRLQRLFMSSETSKDMRWHAEVREKDGKFRHPADSLAWKDFDEKNEEFARDIRNVRLGLASDGFSPFRTMNIPHSTWPVILIPYNLPPWMCMKQSNFILSVLIDGPKGPGDKIDVYMQPLVEELVELWYQGVPTFDHSSNEMFQMRVALLWTINDLPAYANLSGWSTKGKYACPKCGKDTDSCWLKHGMKFCYMGHRRFLPRNHTFRNDRVSFNGIRECKEKPKSLSGIESLHQLESEGVLTQFKKNDLNILYNKRQGKESEKTHNWKKRSIFYELPYWKHNLLRHNLDMMHIEKNVCENILWTLLGVPGKSKDDINARRDLEEWNIRKPLHLRLTGTRKACKPPAPFTLIKPEIDLVLSLLMNVRMPDGYSSNLSKRIKEGRILSLKSHDCHIFMQQLLPLAVRRILPRNIAEPLIELSTFFRQLCSKVNRKADLEYWQDRIAVILCKLEKIFPPSFFTSMMHLPVHLAEEALLGGAIQYRWMYWIERFLLTLKQHVHNKARPEASIAKGYILEECMNFCSRYLDDVKSKSNRSPRKQDGSTRKGKVFHLNEIEWIQAHRYILFNTSSIRPFTNIHKDVIRSNMPRASAHQIQRRHFETFHTWFKNYVQTSIRENGTTFADEIQILANGPDNFGKRYKSYVVNGVLFRVKSLDDTRITQNCGVALEAETLSYASRKDKNPRMGGVYYYGKLIDIVQIRYTNEMQFVMFKCDWVDNNRGKRVDVFGLTSVNFNHSLYRIGRFTDEPFILSSQAVLC